MSSNRYTLPLTNYIENLREIPFANNTSREQAKGN
jgi:hypothetical protein